MSKKITRANLIEELRRELPASRSNRRKALPPGWLFHGGPKDVLEKDAKRGEISKADWDKHIMNGASLWSLPQWRRGFYGSQNPLRALGYGDFAADTGKKPWIVAFKLRDDARRPPRAVGHAFDSLENPRFGSWVEKNAHRFGVKDAEQLIKRLRKSGELDEDGRILSLPRGDFNERVPETLGSKIVNAYLEDSPVEVVEDSQEDASWYVRRPEAIEQIVGEPAELLKIMNTPIFWKFEAGEIGLPSLVLVAAQSLAALPNVEDRMLTELKDNIRAAMPKRPFGFDEILIGFYETVIRIVDLYAQYRDQSRVDNFAQCLSWFMSKKLKGHVKKMQNRDLFDPLLAALEKNAQVKKRAA